ncbi:hypothetical protein NQ315_000773 [Exocentrus adspersus]|uniref:Uncharacterized protein n=1 Tax=Exocentrus adspersus TaxID=1586481 RepID=A0AAV8WDH3_9CUCU|nr:hypothetical protein NQ315_000773 [Exocentrus adspersus]
MSRGQFPIQQFCWNSKKNAQTDRQSLCSEMAEELRFAVRCHGSRQRPALRRSCTRCSPATTYVPAALDLPHINGHNTLQVIFSFLINVICRYEQCVETKFNIKYFMRSPLKDVQTLPDVFLQL